MTKVPNGRARTSSGRDPRCLSLASCLALRPLKGVARRRGRPRKASPKVNQTLRLDADVVEAYRRQGRGWQTQINAVLRAHMGDSRK